MTMTKKWMAMMTRLMLLATWLRSKTTADRQMGERWPEEVQDFMFGCM